jgi:hypothetical protein
MSLYDLEIGLDLHKELSISAGLTKNGEGYLTLAG